MRSAIVHKENCSAIEWDEEYFKYCEFDGFSIEGGTISSDFIGCSFRAVDWYWELFTQSNFIGCRFNDCTFAGAAFPDTRFVDCSFVNCRFIKDNLDSECDFTKTVAYGCSFENSPGFSPALAPRL